MADKWSPVSCRLSAGQVKLSGQRPTFYHCAMQQRKTTTSCRPFTDLSHFGLELVSLEEYEEHRLVHVSSLHTTTARYDTSASHVGSAELD